MTAEDRRRLEGIWTRFVAREALSPEERATLAQALERDEVFRWRLMHDLQFDGALRALGEVDRGQERVVAAVKALVMAAGRTEEVVAAVRKRIEAKSVDRGAASPATPRRSRFPWGATATFAVLAAAAAMILLRPQMDPRPSTVQSERRDGVGAAPVASAPRRSDEGRSFEATPGRASPANQPARPVIGRLVAMAGPAYRHGPDGIRRAAPTLELSAGDWISLSGGGARAHVAGPGGSQIELVGDVVAGLNSDGVAAAANQAPAAEGVRLFVAHGRASAVLPAGSGGAKLTLASPHAMISMLSGSGTLKVDVGTSVTRVEVRDGRARVSALGIQRGTDVEAGQLALVSADDLQPPRAQAAREVLLLIGPDDTKEPAPQEGGLRASEERLKARLEHLGFHVSVADAATLLPERARSVALLVLSSSVSSQLLGPAFSELPVPMLVLESTGFEQLGLTGSAWKRDVGPTGSMSEIVIANPSHPLAAGLTGTVRVLSVQLGMRWGAPASSATRIATYAGAPEQASLLFGYDRGANTVTGIAPARRVGLFLGNGRVIRALNEQGWRLFDAAVLWASAG